MSAATLREAASLIRANAEAAIASAVPVSGWFSIFELMGDGKTREDATHIATFASPAVALAVADWLDDVGATDDDALAALAVARAYLNEPA